MEASSTFAEKFQLAIEEKRQKEPNYGLRTVARILADGDKDKVEVIRRRLHKYRPKTPGGAAIVPTEPTRREIEKAMGLEQDALKPDVNGDRAAARAQQEEFALFQALLDRADARAVQRERVA